MSESAENGATPRAGGRERAQEIAAGVLSARQSLIPGIAAAVAVELLPYVGQLGARAHRDLSVSIDREVEIILRCALEQARMSPAQLASMIGLGLGATESVPSYAILRAHRTIIRALRGALKAAADPSSPQDKRAFALLKTSVVLIEAQIVAEVTRMLAESTSSHVEPTESESEIAQILRGEPLQGSPAGFTPGAFHVVVVIADPAGAPENLATAAADHVIAGLDEPYRAVAEQVRAATTIVIPLAAQDDAVRRIRVVVEESVAKAASGGGRTPTAAIGRAEAGIAGINRSYRQAQRALECGGGLHSDRSVVTFDEALPALALASDPTLLNAVLVVLEPLSHSSDPAARDLLVTLEAVLESNGSTAAAARRLGVHRHTLTSRIERIEEILRRSLRDPSDLLLLHLAVIARRVIGCGPTNGK